LKLPSISSVLSLNTFATDGAFGGGGKRALCCGSQGLILFPVTG